MNGRRFVTWAGLFVNANRDFVFRVKHENDAHVTAVMENQTQNAFVETFETLKYWRAKMRMERSSNTIRMTTNCYLEAIGSL